MAIKDSPVRMPAGRRKPGGIGEKRVLVELDEVLERFFVEGRQQVADLQKVVDENQGQREQRFEQLRSKLDTRLNEIQISQQGQADELAAVKEANQGRDRQRIAKLEALQEADAERFRELEKRQTNDNHESRRLHEVNVQNSRIWKTIGTFALPALTSAVIALFCWVWNSNTQIATLQKEFDMHRDDVREHIDTLEAGTGDRFTRNHAELLQQRLETADHRLDDRLRELEQCP